MVKNQENNAVKVSSLDALRKSISTGEKSLSSGIESFANAGCEANQKRPRNIAFVCPTIPHPSEIDLWNSVAGIMKAHATVITNTSEETAFREFEQECANEGKSLHLELIALSTVTDNRTFLAGIDEHIKDADLVVAVGETSLSTFQVSKARRQFRNRMVIWQTTPRPPEATLGARTNGMPNPDLARQKALRREVMRSCDAILSFDKDSSTWAYLDNVNAQRIRRVSRGINLKRFNSEMNATQRITLREALGLPEADFIFLQAGPLELESGALDSVYAFKSLLQSHPSYLNNTKLVFCGTGSSGADVRQAVVDLQLDDHVFFLNPNDPNTKQIIGNQMANLLAISDAIIHNPLTAINGMANRNLDCTYDVLCALASGLSVVSNGNGWVGDFIARFYNIFSASNIHSQARGMRECIEKQDKLVSIKKQIQTAMQNELELTRASRDIANVLQSILSTDVRYDGKDTEGLINTIEDLVKAQRYLDAIQLISNAFQDPSLSAANKATLFRLIGDCFTKLGDLDNGSQNYLRALENDPYCAKSLIGLGTVALQRRQYNLAVPHFQKAVSLTPKDHLANLGLSLAFEGLGELKQAVQWASRSCTLNIEDTAAIYTLVRLAHELNEFTDAELVLSRYVSLHPHDVNMTFALGGIAFQTGNMDMATQLMETILMLDPMNTRAHGLLAQIQRKLDTRKQA
jgi:tetratricopeptide (TPR) repeat protein